MSMENQKPEPQKNEEEQDDLYAMRSTMSDREDAPNAAEEKDGLIKNIGKIFTRKLPPVETIDENQELSPEAEDQEAPTADQESILKNNETKVLPELDEKELFTTNTGETIPNSEANPTDFIENKIMEDERNDSFETSAFHESPTISRDTIKTKPLEELHPKDLSDFSKTKPLPDIDNEDFVEKITASLRNDLEELGEGDDTSPQTPKEIFMMDDLMVEDIENEIEHADEVSNPFVIHDDDENDDDFISRLEEMFPEQNKEDTVRTKPLTLEDEFTEFLDDGSSLSQEKWEQVFKATQETTPAETEKNRLLNAGNQENINPPTFEDAVSEEEQNNSLDLNDLEFDEVNPIPTPEKEEDGDLNTLRQSFIEEFEQSPWTAEDEEDDQNKPWFVRKWKAFKDWVITLSTAEKVLMFLSIVISVTVIVAIAMVAFEWNLNRNSNAAPPQTLEVLNDLEIYPTGLQLPGGWFFFLKQGQIQQSGSIGKWEPEGAEWLAGTTIRRVVAIPWSKQAEAVALSLEDGDEIRLFLNNNEISSFYVEEIKSVEYDNVRDTMIDTQPSLAVILYRDDKADRFVIIARPK